MKLAVGMRLTNNSVWWRMANRNVAGVSRTSSCRSDREIVDRQLKNLIGKFQTRSSPLRARCSMPQPLGSTSETTVTVTISASVCADWPARDPIWERGELGLYVWVHNSGMNGTDALGLSVFTPCAASVSSLNLQGNKSLFGTLGVSWALNGSINASCKNKCCGQGTANVGQSVVDTSVGVSINGNLKLSGSTWGGGFDYGTYSVSWWAGVKVNVGVAGSVSGTINSDRCNNNDLNGKVCMQANGFGSIAGGGGSSIQVGPFNMNFGADITGQGNISVERCYECNAGNCSWGSTKVCLGATASVNINAVFGSVSWQFLNANTCFTL